MKLETVGGVPVGYLGFQVCRKVDDMNRTKRALLWANTTTNAQAFRDEGDLGLGRNLDAKFSGADNGAGLFTFLTTFLIGEIRCQ